MDRKVADTENDCLKCIKSGKSLRPVPLKMTDLPRTAWESLAIDINGPYQRFGGVSVVVLVDLYSRFVVAKVLHLTIADKLIEFLEEVFDKYGGYPRTIKMENGPPFQSSCKKFQDYLKAKNILCYHSTEIHPQQNGTAERYMKIVNKVAEKSNSAWEFRCDLKDRIKQHNRAPNRMTGVPPIDLIYGRKVRDGNLPLVGSAELEITPEEISERNDEIKQRTKELEDAKRGAKTCDLEQGDKILVERDERFKGKGISRFAPEPATVLERKSGDVTFRKADGSVMRRNVTKITKVPASALEQPGHELGQPSEEAPSIQDMVVEQAALQKRQQDEAQVELPRSYPKRHRKLPARYVILWTTTYQATTKQPWKLGRKRRNISHTIQFKTEKSCVNKA